MKINHLFTLRVVTYMKGNKTQVFQEGHSENLGAACMEKRKEPDKHRGKE